MLRASGTVCRSSRFSSTVLPSSMLNCLASSKGVSSCAGTQLRLQLSYTSTQGTRVPGHTQPAMELWRERLLAQH